MKSFKVDCVCQSQAGCGEGPVWDHRTGLLWWVDISEERIHFHRPETGENGHFETPYLISSLVLSETGLLIATAQGVARLDPATGDLTPLHAPEPEIRGNRLNDMIAAPDGALWAGTMSEGAKGPTGALYRYSKDGLETLMTGTTISNGLAWTPDQTRLYFIDSVPGILYARENGEWTVIREFDASTGRPDGMTVDANGILWVAICDRGEVVGMTPEGEILHHIHIPCEIVTSCAFGGDDLKTLYVTTGTFSMTEDEKIANPLAGGLFAIRMETPGLRSYTARWPA